MVLQQSKGVVGRQSGASARSWQDDPGSGGCRAVQAAEKTGKLASGTERAMSLVEKTLNDFCVLQCDLGGGGPGHLAA